MSQEESTNPDTIFTCLAVILLSFFLFLNSMAEPKADKTKKVLGSVGNHFPYIPPIPRGDELTVPAVQGQSLATRWGNIPDIGKGGNSDIQPLGDKLRITLSSDLLFVDGDSLLQPQSLKFLNALAKEITERKFALEIEAHTDNVANLSARYPSVWTLSIQRAQAMYRLFRDYGVQEEKLLASGFAASRPEFSNDTDAGRGKNRRIVLLLSEGKLE